MIQSAQLDRELTFSLIIPTRNEAHDIEETLKTCLAIHYPHKEIIVVDDSSDNTPQIVGKYSTHNVKLLHREQNHDGCCGARNLGMRYATGDVIVIINADVRPAADLLDQLAKHYEQGADLVVGRSQVRNRDRLYGRYLHAKNMVGWLGGREPFWSEGFSCRRSAAEAVGYIPGSFPVPFCRDNLLSQKLVAANYKKHYDPYLIIEHDSPKTFREFWGNQVWRASFSASYYYYFHNRSLLYLIVREAVKVLRIFLMAAIIVPVIYRCIRLTRYTSGPHVLPELIWIDYVAEAARIHGTIRGLKRLAQAIQAAQRAHIQLPRYSN